MSIHASYKRNKRQYRSWSPLGRPPSSKVHPPAAAAASSPSKSAWSGARKDGGSNDTAALTCESSLGCGPRREASASSSSSLAMAVPRAACPVFASFSLRHSLAKATAAQPSVDASNARTSSNIRRSSGSTFRMTADHSAMSRRSRSVMTRSANSCWRKKVWIDLSRGQTHSKNACAQTSSSSSAASKRYIWPHGPDAARSRHSPSSISLSMTSGRCHAATASPSGVSPPAAGSPAA
mmetsp:Transcript_10383/g.30817  ORF Transcript_10383/g.30817 Transcript_10383/m.30817 type:complete len:237 (-) Transcript_10383:10-720(-)